VFGRVRRRLPRIERHGAAALAAVALAVLAGCGSSGDSDESGAVTQAGPEVSDQLTATLGTTASKASDDALVREALDAVFASGDPAKACETYVTPNYVISAYGDLDGCRAAQTSGAAAKSVAVDNVKVASGAATATVVPAGGPSAGEKIDVILVQYGDIWKVDTASANVPVGP
jgi:hypothetical protein